MGSLGFETYTAEIECLLPENRFTGAPRSAGSKDAVKELERGSWQLLCSKQKIKRMKRLTHVELCQTKSCSHT